MRDILIFIAGLGIGAVITNKLVKEKYQQIADEEIASVKETFSKYNQSEEKCESEGESEPKTEETEQDFMEYAKILNERNYVNYSDISEEVIEEKEEEKTMDDVGKPYIIEPSEYGEFVDYTEISLTYYSDGVLTDELNEPLEDIESSVGRDNLKRIGEYEDDALHVRNDVLKCDYEILVDLRRYVDVINDRYPHRVEV